jgi:hypothetical protein
MHGGQWQALYLIERLKDAKLLAPEGSELLTIARERGIEAAPLSFVQLRGMALQSEIVHAHDARAHTIAAFAGGAPLVVSRRVGFPVRTSMASRWKYGRAARYLAISRYAADRLEDAGVAREKIRIVHDGLPLPELSRREPGRVIALSGKCEESVRAAAKEANVPIHFTANLWEDLSTASIFVYASELEGLGSAALAASAAGIPVIASGRGGLAEAVEHEQTGLVTAPEQIGQALKRLLADPEEAAEMGRRGRARVERSFTVDAMATATGRAYREVVGKA